MAFVSFPHSNIEDEERSQTIYDKMYSAATQMFHSFLNEDGNSDAAQQQQQQQNADQASTHTEARSPLKSGSRKPSYVGSDRASLLSMVSSLHKPNGGGSLSNASNGLSINADIPDLPERSPNTPNTPNTPTSRPAPGYAGSVASNSEAHSGPSAMNTPTKSANTNEEFVSNASNNTPAPSANTSASGGTVSGTGTNIASSSDNITHNSNPGSETRSISGSAVDSSNRPELLRSSTTSSATVGVSSAQAVPLLPTASSPTPSDIIPFFSEEPYDSYYTEENNNLRRSSVSSDSNSVLAPSSLNADSSTRPLDVESLFSVSSTSASRAYLASQYSRSRSRAAPGRLSREFWMKDESATSCFSCNRAFTTFRRKHHCRVCGQIFCSACTKLIDGERCGASNRRVRCCKTCEESLASHSSSEDEGDMSFQSQIPDDSVRWPDIPDDSQSLRHDVGNNSLGPALPSSTSINTHSLMDLYEVDDGGRAEAYSRMPSPAAIDDMHFARSFLGTTPTSHVSRSRSRSLSRSKPPPQQQLLKEDEPAAITRPVRSNSQGTSSTLMFIPPQGLGNTNNSTVQPSSVGSHNSLLNHKPSFGTSALISSNSSSTAIGAGPTSTLTHSGYTTGANLHSGDEFPLSTAKFPNSATVEFNNASLTYLQLFLDQLLKDSELDPEEWKPILTAPLLEVAAGLHLEINDRLSPREWVKIKRIPGGTPHDIDCINGTIFTHSLARKSMKQQIRYPRILLITFPIEYARNERYMSLEPVVAQEKEYLRKLVARVLALKPTLLLTCSHICGQALDMLEAAGISVAQYVRESALFRLSKISKADILISIDRLSAAPQLGTCDLFEQRSYRYENVVKTFLFFFVRPADPGRCALVRGEPELSSVIKVVLEVMAEICYSLKAETALMRDQFVIVPSLTDVPEMILSSSPFVDYGRPYLQQLSHRLEDEVVELGNKIDETTDPELKYVLSSRMESIRVRWVDTARAWDAIEISYPFMFNPSSHQNLVVLYSLISTETATPCVGPDAQLIEFYLNTDQTLGKFIESSIGQASMPCPDDCQRTVGDHYRAYVNGNGMVTVYTENMPCKVPGLENSILMWSYCKICDQQMPIVPMSSTTWKCSMGKYLELSFYGQPLKMRASTCTHNVYRDHIRYFGWHGYALKIEYSTVELNEIYGPPKMLRLDPEVEVQFKHNAYQEWNHKLSRFWASTVESLSKVKVEGLDEEMTEKSQSRLEQLKSKAENDRKECSALLDRIYDETPPDDYLSLNTFLEGYQQLLDQWHQDLAAFDEEFFPTERDIRRVTAQYLRGLVGEEGAEKPKSIHRNSVSSIKTSDKHSIKNGDENASNHLRSGSVATIRTNASSTTVDTRHGSQTSTTSIPPIPVRFSNESEKDSSKDEVIEDDINGDGDEYGPENHDDIARSVPAKGSHFAELLQKKDVEQMPFRDTTEDATVLDDNLRYNDELMPRTPEAKREISDKSEKASTSSHSPSVRAKSKTGNDINLLMPGINEPSIKDGGGRVALLARQFEEVTKAFESERRKEKEILKERHKPRRIQHAHPVAEVFENVAEAIDDIPHTQLNSRPPHSRSKSQSHALPTAQKPPNSPPQITESRDDGSSPNYRSQTSQHQHPQLQSLQNRHGHVTIPESEPLNMRATATAANNEDVVDKGSQQPAAENQTPISDPQAALQSGEVPTGINQHDKESDETKKAEPVKTSVIQALGMYWAERSSTRWNGIEYILGTHEYYHSNIPVVLRESEPSSLVAYCLSLPDYQARVREFYEDTPGISRERPQFDSEGSNDSLGMGNSDSNRNNDHIYENAMLRATGTHLKYNFEQLNTKVSCKIFFSEQFDGLRRKCGIADKFVQSLSRCSTWDSAGGKSGSAFLKTLDDRLILKELSHAEFGSFVNFAPSYFEYMSQALFHDLPTVLAKIFGVYQVTMRNSQTSQQVKMYVLVMENLFYGAKFNKFFDLKGSMRNRKVTETGKANEVLLDENMVEYIYETPVFVREHSKRMLKASLYNDTLFLTKMNVMDYSLVIGLDDEKNVIVAGIIDYIRTYTWDKKIESWVKTRAATVGIKEPTVVSPKQYKGRFRESMERYFVMVPDCWSQQSV